MKDEFHATHARLSAGEYQNGLRRMHAHKADRHAHGRRTAPLGVADGAFPPIAAHLPDGDAAPP
jgi:hypothetical protein